MKVNKKLIRKLFTLNLCTLGGMVLASLMLWKNIFSGNVLFILFGLSCSSILYSLIFFIDMKIKNYPKVEHSKD